MLDFIIKYWIQFAFGILIMILSYFFKQFIKYKKKIDETTIGVKTLLKLQIIICYENLINKEYISIQDKKNILELYAIYKKLDSSPIIDDLMTKLAEIKVE
jgi:hypothetical protein